MAALDLLRLISPGWIAASLLIGTIPWLIGLAIYRVHLHPLVKVPGPFWAKVTHLYSFFQNVSGPGSRFYLEIERLHEQYGPVVRIGPDEIHLSDPENYEKIYYTGSKYWKSPRFYRGLGLNTAAFGTPSNELHRIRRAALNPLFSRKRVFDLEDIVQEKVAKLCQRLESARGTQEPVDLHHGFRSISVDVITDYAFDNCYNLLDAPDLGKSFADMIKLLAPRIWVCQQFPIVVPISKSIPPWLGRRLNKHLAVFLAAKDDCEREIRAIKSQVESGEKDPDKITIFHQLLNPNATEGHVVPSVDDLIDEAFTLLGAAADTTGSALTTSVYHSLANPEIYRKLSQELLEAFPGQVDKLSFVHLEKLPYLTAVIKEGLRLSFGVPGRLPRVVPDSGGNFNGYFVPKGTVVGMSSWLMHRNPDIFPDPEKFVPERWLDQEGSQRLDKYLVAFGKGSRQCVGINLAYCELYVTLGNLFRRFDRLQATEMSEKDFEFDDYFGAYFPDSARKLHVFVPN